MTSWLAPGDFSAPSRARVAEASRAGAAFARPRGLGEHPRTIRDEGSGGTVLHVRIVRLKIGGIAVTILVAAPSTAIDGARRAGAHAQGTGVAPRQHRRRPPPHPRRSSDHAGARRAR